MALFATSKAINRLNKMIDNAALGNAVESGFDESKMSALETRLAQFLSATSVTRNQLAEEKARISELISDISHQTKTPIANILLYSQLLEEASLPKTENEYVRSLVAQAEKLNFLIASLVKTSRLETGIISVVPTQCALSPMIEEVIAQIAPKAEQKGIKISYQPTSVCAVADPKWTSEALYNIADNAVKYTPNGGAVDISVTAYQLFCRIDVKDNGIGISEGDLPKVFARFYRSSDVSEQEGVGIGLYLAREIVAAEGGYIKVSSAPDKGSTFSVFLAMNT